MNELINCKVTGKIKHFYVKIQEHLKNGTWKCRWLNCKDALRMQLN